MIFNSWVFLLFFILVYSLYLRLALVNQNRLLILASWVFYGFWDMRFLCLLIASSVIDFFLAQGIHRRSGTPKRLYLCLSIFINLSVLGFFKYCDFFIINLLSILHHLSIPTHLHTLNIIVPVGISFYTFQSISYMVDVYRGNIRPCQRLDSYLLFVAFFPQLVAGPIERAKHLITQIQEQRHITPTHLQQGFWLILKGFFFKVFIADNLATSVDAIFTQTSPSSTEVLIGIYAFAFQIYGDFAGYTHMARGISSLMGFNLMLNFKAPYLACNPSDFWQRWHISLSQWLRDYLYIPLGGNRQGITRTCLNLFLTMFLGGLWHGANWTFVLWGIYHGILLISHRLLQPIKNLWAWPKFIKQIVFFHLICFGWLLFRSKDFSQIQFLIQRLCSAPVINKEIIEQGLVVTMLILPCLLWDIWDESRSHQDKPPQLPLLLTLVWCLMLLILIYLFGQRGGNPFIYFQF